MNLVNKTIVLTGASGGIGIETAKLLAEQQCHLILVGRNTRKLEKIAQQLIALNRHKPVIVSADLSSEDGRNKVTALANGVDGLINLAGVNSLALFEGMDDADINRIMRSNLIDPMLLARNFIPHLKNKPEAAILNVGSIIGSIGMAGSVAYCASKFGLRGFTESLRRELEDTNISVSFVAPRTTQTNMNTDAASELYTALGNSVDDPKTVAVAIVEALENSGGVNLYLGWPEKLFVKVNALFPKIVDSSLSKQLPIIKKHIQTNY